MKQTKRCLYISDTHFGHVNVIDFDKRPFKTVEEMDEAMIKSWQNVVTDNDVVHVLGDFSLYKGDKTLEILDALPGEKILIKGNHDRVSPQFAKRFSKVCDYLDFSDNGKRVILSHYPLLFWNAQFRDSVHLYGHVHNSLQQDLCMDCKDLIRSKQDLNMKMYNVGCMMPWMNYAPKTLAEIEASATDDRNLREG